LTVHVPSSAAAAAATAKSASETAAVLTPCFARQQP
jgi:hypothetical protein